jgi:hypothetical protein
MALASDSERTGVLESLVETYQRLGLQREAAATCERLARKLDDPHKKAEVLYRRGEILRVALSDLEGANDAYLRSSDMDPSFAPTLARLVTYYWERGDLSNLAEVGSGLMRTSARPLPGEPDLPFLVAVAAILASKEEELVSKALAEVRFEVDPVARRLGELVRLSNKPAAPTVPASGGGESGARKLPDERGIFEKLDAVIATMRTATPLQFEADLCATRRMSASRCWRPICNSAAVGWPWRARRGIWRCFSSRIWRSRAASRAWAARIPPSRPPGARRWPSIPCATGPCAACCAL